MKHLLFATILLFGSLLTASCTDDAADGGRGTDTPKPIQINLSLFANNPAQLRNSRSWNYDYTAAEGEKIQSGFVVMLNDKRVVEQILYTLPSEEKQDKQDLSLQDSINSTKINTTTGIKTFISFANVTIDQINQIIADRVDDQRFKIVIGKDMPTAADSIIILNLGFPVRAGKFNTNKPSKTNGIPMAGMHSVVLREQDDGKTRYLYVERMVAKLQFDFTNQLGSEVTINSIDIDRLTDDAADDTETTRAPGNLKAFPYPETPTAAIHITVTPNLTEAATQSVHSYDVNKTLANGAKESFSIYVNETDVPANEFHQFGINVHLTLADGTTTQQRYALITNDNGEWDYIARNDWRVIPITLQDYRLQLVPRDYPPIGVLPSSVKEEDGRYVCTFYADGDFHLMPQLVRYSDGSVVENWTGSNATWETTDDNTSLYEERPDWYTTGGYVHGTFAKGATGQSIHHLKLTCQPQDGVARRYVAPVIIMKK